MIDIKELRIGNWVSACDGSRWMVETIKPETISGYMYSNNLLNDVQEKNRSVEIHDENLNPIPLSEKLLLKCRFEPRNSGIKTYYNPLLELDHDFKLMRVDYNIQVKSLHQLQNLYFDLTGQELEVDL